VQIIFPYLNRRRTSIFFLNNYQDLLKIYLKKIFFKTNCKLWESHIFITLEEFMFLFARFRSLLTCRNFTLVLFLWTKRIQKKQHNDSKAAIPMSISMLQHSKHKSNPHKQYKKKIWSFFTKHEINRISSAAFQFSYPNNKNKNKNACFFFIS
jgi:hypothetical protein